MLHLTENRDAADQGVSGAELQEEDFVTRLLTCSTHDYLLFFTSRGRVYWVKAMRSCL